MKRTIEMRESRSPRLARIAFSPWLAIDAVLWAAALMLAVWTRFDFSIGQLLETLAAPRFALVLLALISASSLAGWFIGIYRGRFVPGSLLEWSALTATFGTATIGVSLLHIISGENTGLPRSAPIVAGAFSTLAALALRSVIRRKELFGAGAASGKEPAIVFGAGEGGLQLIRQLRRSEVSQFRPVAVLDDDATKLHMIIDGVRVRGNREKLEEVARRTGAGALIVAIPSLAREELLAIRDQAEASGLHVLVLPPLNSLMRGRVAADELREINVNDLLGRKPAMLNQTQIAQHLRGKRILVTGAGGSIGSELCRQLVPFRPAELVMLDRDESGLHAVQLSINDQAMLDGDDTILASIRDRETLQQIFSERRPQVVFHAAALKHMPLLERYPLEAIKTNVLGTQNVLEAADAGGVEIFVNISTDKAANPCSVLGRSKRIAERLTAAKASRSDNAKFVSVRFGNVLGSRGSVLTVFERQIEAGGPITVTDPDVKRFFMTIPEACQLVLQAAVVGSNGETTVLDMGNPVRIADVARTLIEESGKEIEVVYTGLRENEKLSEELFDESEESNLVVKHEAITGVRVEPFDLNSRDELALRSQGEAKAWLFEALKR